jgi:hypothetical protein
MAQPIGIVAVLVAQTDLVDALPKLLTTRVADPRRITGVA